MLNTRGRFKYEHLHKYPHLLPADIDVWVKYITKYPDKFDRVDYDVHVGDGIEPDERLPANIVKMAIHLTQMRIDVVGYKGKNKTIIELKDRSTSSAIGQLIAYEQLYKRTFGTTQKFDLLLITNYITRDVLFVAAQNNITVTVVE